MCICMDLKSGTAIRPYIYIYLACMCLKMHTTPIETIQTCAHACTTLMYMPYIYIYMYIYILCTRMQTRNYTASVYMMCTN